MILKETVKSTLVMQVVAQMEQLIEARQWDVGMRIPPESELVKQLGVSRNTVREAVQALVHMGLLEPRQGDGTYVRAHSVLGATFLRQVRRSGIAETLEVRQCLESEAARLAALRRTDEDIARLQDCLTRHHQAAQNHDFEAYFVTDVELHHAVVLATHNSVLIDLYDHMSEALHTSIRVMMKEHEHEMAQRQRHLHQELITAIIAQNPEAAEEAARQHVEIAQMQLEQQATSASQEGEA
jgi:DNA-binding FadR family transcriptional regulator